ncbi:type II toxin-antitoxin system HipA family toxin [Aquimarina addita]|uniref:Type II toxin-antitoxin system HipA family toxin n=1 Tax=Aquimarina addita TaxID=870485 RepID=A0ABP6UNT9_9FLAO
MVDVIKITLWGQELGALSWDATNKYASFEFFPEFLKNNWDVSPIHMPISTSQKRIYSFPRLQEDTYKGLPGMLSDVLPDDFGNRLIDQWLLLNHIPKAQFTPLDRLCYIGTRGMGALEFQPAKNTITKASKIEIDKLVVLAQQVLNSREKIDLNMADTEHLNELIKVGTSAGGQRAKAIIAYNPKTNEIKSGQTNIPDGFEHYLFKFDGVNDMSLGDPKGYGRIEFAYYLMAVDCGIIMQPSQLFEENGRAHFMTKRFDRLPNNEKLHMQTLCSIAHFDYKFPGVYSYENAFGIMRQLRLPHSDAVQQYKRMLFNVIARNQDDHTKNISFLMNNKGIWKLAPAYDVTYSYNPTGIWTSLHQMSVNGKRDEFTMKDLLEAGEKISYKNSRIAIEEIMQVIANWNIYADKAGIPKKQAHQLQKAFRMHLS